MDLSPLLTLKKKLVSAREFADVFTYFLDTLGENLESTTRANPSWNTTCSSRCSATSPEKSSSVTALS